MLAVWTTITDGAKPWYLNIPIVGISVRDLKLRLLSFRKKQCEKEENSNSNSKVAKNIPDRDYKERDVKPDEPELQRAPLHEHISPDRVDQ